MFLPTFLVIFKEGFSKDILQKASKTIYKYTIASFKYKVYTHVKI